MEEGMPLSAIDRHEDFRRRQAHLQLIVTELKENQQRIAENNQRFRRRAFALEERAQQLQLRIQHYKADLGLD